MAKKQFKAESKRLLDLMINSIYTNKEIFLREIISNASDALDKLHYISLTDEAARKAIGGELRINISVDKDSRTITVTDNGVGMSCDELESNLGTIAKSGSLAFKKAAEASEGDANEIIGQFGVGFYSAFMVADSITVRTRRYDSDTAYMWQSQGADGYSVKECEKDGVGTEIEMHIKEDTEEENYSQYLENYRIRNLVKLYSDYIRYPIKTAVEKTRTEGEGENQKTETYTEIETINSMMPLWKRNKSEITDEDSNRFYRDNFFDSSDPVLSIKISTEGIVGYKALLFVPSAAPYDFFTKDYKKGLKLYSSGVMIMDSCEDLLPEHFRFVRGVVDSDDLSLNISREMLQQDRQLRSIASSIEKKIKSELQKLLENDREKYEKFFAAFGIQLKYGVVSDYGIHKETLKDLLLFYSMKKEKMITLPEYIADMPDTQPHIYYACGDSVKKIVSLPQTELVLDKGYDMLCLTDECDDFVMQALGTVDDKDFRSVNAEDAGLEDKQDADKTAKAAEENRELLDFLKEKITGISDVILSNKLKSHAVCLSASGPVTLEMEKYFATMPGDGPKPKAERVLEINAEHRSFEALKTAYKEDAQKAAVIGEILYCQALLIADMPLENPARYCELVCSLMK